MGWIAGAVLIVIALLGGMLAVLSGGSAAAAGPPASLLWDVEKTSRVTADVPSELRARAKQVAASTGGQLDVQAVGERPIAVGSVSLSVSRDNDGDPEPDETLRDRAVEARLRSVRAGIERADVGNAGFSLYGSLKVMADGAATAPSHRVEVWWSTAALTGSVDPLAMRHLMANPDPVAAADSITRGQLGDLDLTGVELHPVLLTPIGPRQAPLDPISEQWRSAFVLHLATRLGASVATPVHDDAAGVPWPKSSTVDPVIPKHDDTPHSAEPPGQTTVSSDLGFVEETDRLVDPTATSRQLQTIRDQYTAQRRRGMRAIVEVQGYCARSGTADGARALSAQRASVIADLLRGPGGVLDEDLAAPVGLGFDRLADPSQPPTSAAQRVVVVRLHLPNSP